MRAFFVFTTVILALALGVVAHWAAPALAPALAIGFGAAVWAIAHALERMLGRGIWHFSAPYPYRSMRQQRADDLPARQLDATQGSAAGHGPSRLPVAA